MDLDSTVWSAKQQVICSLTESLWDVYNYGLFQPAGEGRDAKFLEEERALRDYLQSFEKGVPYLEVWPEPEKRSIKRLYDVFSKPTRNTMFQV